MRTCRVCHARPAELPDRHALPGRPIKRICRLCHNERLLQDLEEIMLREQEQQKPRCAICGRFLARRCDPATLAPREWRCVALRPVGDGRWEHLEERDRHA